MWIIDFLTSIKSKQISEKRIVRYSMNVFNNPSRGVFKKELRYKKSIKIPGSFHAAPSLLLSRISVIYLGIHYHVGTQLAGY